jgi:GNAT superfamily N-acetyltransferase
MGRVQVIKSSALEDWAFARRTCALTAVKGGPIESDRFSFFGELWIGPYQWFESNTLYIATLKEQPVGYLTGCLKSVRHHFYRKMFFDPLLALRVYWGHFSDNGDTRRFIRRWKGLEKGPEASFPKEWLKNFYREYPAHLHMNVLSGLRGLGVGKELFDRYVQDLKESKVRGLHLFCGEDPLAFYQKMGLTILKKIEFKPGVWVYAMGMKLTYG